MPNRILKETIRTSKSVNKLSDFDFRMWTYLITFVDDYGRGQADPAIVKGFVFPLRKTVTEKQIKESLNRLAQAGMIQIYSVDGEVYLCFPKWSEHQRIQTKRSKYPAPPTVTVDHGEIPLESNPIQSESESNSKVRFAKPTVEEIEEYVRGNSYSIDPQKFYDYYESNGWKVGKNKMVDWRACVRSWNSKERKNKQQVRPSYYGKEVEEQEASDELKEQVAGLLERMSL